MPCKKHESIASDGQAVTMIVCQRGGTAQPKPCDEPHCGRPHSKLCDFPVRRRGKSATCDRTICDGHAHHVGRDLDYCPAHARAATKVTRPACSMCGASWDGDAVAASGAPLCSRCAKDRAPRDAMQLELAVEAAAARPATSRTRDDP